LNLVILNLIIFILYFIVVVTALEALEFLSLSPVSRNEMSKEQTLDLSLQRIISQHNEVRSELARKIQKVNFLLVIFQKFC